MIGVPRQYIRQPVIFIMELIYNYVAILIWKHLISSWDTNT